MEAPQSDVPKLPDMVMCGDHPSFNKTELNVKDAKVEDKEKDKTKDKPMLSCAKISPTPSRADGTLESRARATSDHALRMHEARRRVRDLERDRDISGPARPLVQAFPWAALGSFRWPPYLLAVWVLVLVLTHLLHCLVSVLEKALPALKKCSVYFRAWTENTWRSDADINQKMCPIALAMVTGLLYTLYYGLYAVYAVVLWAIEPLCSDIDEARSSVDMEAKVTDYVDEANNSKTNSSIKQ